MSSDLLSLARLHLFINSPQALKTVTPAGDQVFKHMCMWMRVHTQITPMNKKEDIEGLRMRAIEIQIEQHGDSRFSIVTGRMRQHLIVAWVCSLWGNSLRLPCRCGIWLAVETRGAFDENWPPLVSMNSTNMATDEQPVGSVQWQISPIRKAC